MKKIVVGIIAMLLTLCGITIRSIARHPEWFSQREYEMTDVINYKDVNYSISNIKTQDEYENESHREGYEFVIITVKIENNSEKVIDPNNISWGMDGTSPRTGMSTSFNLINGLVEYNKIQPSESDEIEIVFEVMQNAEECYLSMYDILDARKGVTFRFLLDL